MPIKRKSSVKRKTRKNPGKEWVLITNYNPSSDFQKDKIEILDWDTAHKKISNIQNLGFAALVYHKDQIPELIDRLKNI